MCEVSLWIKDLHDKTYGHSIVEVNTTSGIYHIEPQDDTIIPADELHVGENYYKLVGWDCYWEITKISGCFEKEVMLDA